MFFLLIPPLPTAYDHRRCSGALLFFEVCLFLFQLLLLAYLLLLMLLHHTRLVHTITSYELSMYLQSSALMIFVASY